MMIVDLSDRASLFIDEQAGSNCVSGGGGGCQPIYRAQKQLHSSLAGVVPALRVPTAIDDNVDSGCWWKRLASSC